MSPARDTLQRHLARAKRALFQRAAERTALPLVALGAALLASALVLALVATLYRGHYAALRIALLIGAGLHPGGRRPPNDPRAPLGGSDRHRSGIAPAGAEGRDPGRVRIGAGSRHRHVGLPPGRGHRTRRGSRRGFAAGETLRLARAPPLARHRRELARCRGGIAAVAGGPRTPLVLAHIADPASAPRAPIGLRVTTGAAEIDGGATVVIRAYVRGTSARARLLTRRGDEWVESNMSVSDAAVSDAAHSTTTAADNAAASDEKPRPGERADQTRLPNLKEDVHYRVEAADAESPVYTLAVRDLPRATGYRIRYDYPAYTGLKAEETQALTGISRPRAARGRISK